MIVRVFTDHKIRIPVVPMISIDMMDTSPNWKRTTKSFFCNQKMFIHVSIDIGSRMVWILNPDIPGTVQDSPTFPSRARSTCTVRRGVPRNEAFWLPLYISPTRIGFFVDASIYSASAEAQTHDLPHLKGVL